MSDVPVLAFIEVENKFICVIEHPDGLIENHELGDEYDTASELYLAIVESYRHSTQ